MSGVPTSKSGECFRDDTFLLLVPIRTRTPADVSIGGTVGPQCVTVDFASLDHVMRGGRVVWRVEEVRAVTGQVYNYIGVPENHRINFTSLLGISHRWFDPAEWVS